MTQHKKRTTSQGAGDFNDGAKRKKYQFTPRSNEQKELFNTILERDLTFAVGPAGTGKTHVMAAAIEHAYRNGIRKIYLCRPAVDAGEDLGYFKGDVDEKIAPYFRPLFDELDEVFGKEKRKQMMEDGEIELASFATMRGRTLKNAIVVLDEAQNTTIAQMKLFLTRIGSKAKVIISGDLKQNDLKTADNGLSDAIQRFSKYAEVGIVKLTKVVRSRIASMAVEAYGDENLSTRLPKAAANNR